MKKFIICSLLFSSPLIVLMLVIEHFAIQVPNSYKYKYDYIKKYGNRIEVLAIGHSQLYDGFNAKLCDFPSFNLCNSSQTYRDNYYLLKELLMYMPKLKTVIIPIGYMNVIPEGKNDLTYDVLRSRYYYEYMHIDYDGDLPFSYRYEALNLKNAIEKISTYYLKHKDIIGCDSLGMRCSHLLKSRVKPLGYEKLIEHYTCKVDNKFEIGQEEYLLNTINILRNKRIAIVLVSPPYYWNYTQEYNKKQKLYSDNFISELCKKYPEIKHLNFETDTSFVECDFFNETHLSEFGAEKMTKKINELLNN